jgi:PleD family two-component response regulator
MERLREKGFGTRPDGARVTASIGLSERIEDQAADWRQLVEIADRRMYLAKQSGKDRLVSADDVDQCCKVSDRRTRQ